MIKYILVLAFIATSVLYSASNDNQISLNGFYLLQTKNAVTNIFGNAPTAHGINKYSTWDLYAYDNNSYIVFEYLTNNPNYIYSLQLTGYENKNMYLFKGCRLGDSKYAVLAKIGKPDNIKHIRDKLYAYDYTNRNYSIEFNQDKLYSIRIQCYKELDNAKISPFDWQGFKDVLISKNIKKIKEYLRPDFEIFKGSDLLSVKGPFESFKITTGDEYYNILFVNRDSVLSEIISNDKPESALRIIMGVGIGIVYKFKKDDALQEIVLFPYNNKYRVFEIKYKK
ncbi:MAG: hypothetical protein HZC28_09650 [Spirochaetes bacterium]|nr:hypothetical protein [Spirochaetota bacterium]